MKTTNLFRTVTLALGLCFSLLPSIVYAQFTPGEGGTINFTPFVPETGKFGGFLVKKSDREYDSWFQSTRSSIDMEFPAASTLGAESLTVQHLKSDGVSWETFLYNGNELTTTGNNFWIRLTESETLRLIANGGPKSGFTSNTVVASPSNVNTRFSSYGLDESMWISGIMVPWVGRGLQGRFTVKNTPAETEVNGGLIYQWYRVNPVTYAMTPIAGADSLTYITTNSDIGYKMMINATGNGTTVGGHVNYMSENGVVEPNKVFVDNITTEGFKLNLFKSVSNIPLDELVLYDKDYVKVAITSISKAGNDATYNVVVPLQKDKEPYEFQNSSSFWRIASEVVHPGISMMREGVLFSFPTTGIETQSVSVRIYPLPAIDVLNFSSNSVILSAEVIDISGKSMIFTSMENSSVTLNVSNLPTGIYFLQLKTGEGYKTQKFNIIK